MRPRRLAAAGWPQTVTTICWLEEVVYLLDTTGEAPVDLVLQDIDGGEEITFAMVDATTLPQVGAVPKAVSLNELHMSHRRRGWRCSVTLDV